MALNTLERNKKGECLCPSCGGLLKYKEGDVVKVVDGKLDMDAAKPKYECGKCGVFYREVLGTGYYDVFSMSDDEKRELHEEEEALNPCSKDPMKLKNGSDGAKVCPVCQNSLRFVEGGAVRVVDGKVDMDNVKPKYECDHCNVFYREVLTSGYYHAYPLTASHKKKVISTGDLQPMVLKRDANNQCVCPRCGEKMDYIDSEAVKIVDGKADLENVKAHFLCNNCNSVFRRIVNTDFFQWSEK